MPPGDTERDRLIRIEEKIDGINNRLDRQNGRIGKLEDARGNDASELATLKVKMAGIGFVAGSLPVLAQLLWNILKAAK